MSSNTPRAEPPKEPRAPTETYEVCITKNDTTICSEPMKLREASQLFEYYKKRGVDVVVRLDWRHDVEIYRWSKKGQ